MNSLTNFDAIERQVIYRKKRKEGLTHEEAVKAVNAEIRLIKQNHRQTSLTTKANKGKINFSAEFQAIKHRRRI